MSVSPELKREMLARVQAFLQQHERDLMNAGIRADQAMLTEIELYGAIPEKLRRILDRSGPHEIYERLRKGCPAIVDRIYAASKADSNYYQKVLDFWEAMKGHEEMASGEDEEDSLPGENEDENRVPLRAGASRQATNPQLGGLREEFERPEQNGVCEEVDLPATSYDVPVEPPADEPAQEPDPPSEDFVEEDGVEDDTEEEG